MTTRASHHTGFVFARGGSKGIPRKNLQQVGGKPLIAHAIAQGLATRSLERVCVSTDDDEIARVARQWGAEVPFQRPAELARDDAPELLSWRHAIEAMAQMGAPLEIFVSLPATSPLRRPEDIDRCVELLESSSADLVITVRQAQRNPYFNMVQLDESGRARLVLEASGGVHRRQDAPPIYDITTVAYVARPDYVLRTDHLLAGEVRVVEIPELRSIDIDTPDDLAIARFLYDYLQHEASEHA